MEKTKAWRLLAMLFAVSLIAAACGSDSAGSDDTSTEETTEETTADTEADAEEDVEEEMTDDTDADAEDESMESMTEEAAPSCTGESDGVLTVGGLLPETGSLAFLGPPEFAAAQLAVNDINAAGGVNDADVVWSPGDSSDNGDVANQTVDRHLAEGADVILGAASSSVSLTVIDKVTGACKIHFSPANTSSTFTDYPDDDLYFRTAPADVIQGQVLADLIVNEGSETVSMLVMQDAYGEGLRDHTTGPLEEQGASVLPPVTYDPAAQTFDAEVTETVAAGADAIIVIGFDESSQILTGLFEAGISAETTKIYLVDGNVGNALGENFTEAGTLSGVAGTRPSAPLDDDFKARLLEVDSELVDFSYGPETYDAVIITALAAEIAGTDDPAMVASYINGVTRDGEVCTSFEDCKALIAAGTDIDYDGPSGPQAFSQAGEPTEASYAIERYGDDNQIDDSLTTYEFGSIS